LKDPWPLFNAPGPRLSIRIADSSVVLPTCPTAGEVSSDNPAMVPKMISFQLMRFIMYLLFLDSSARLIQIL
jgi:hypothetical protein